MVLRYRCTRLTSLDLSMLYPHSLSTMFTVGGLPEGITALQRLQRLRLNQCVTAPLACSISQLTQLTSLEFLQDELYFLEVQEEEEEVGTAQVRQK